MSTRLREFFGAASARPYAIAQSPGMGARVPHAPTRISEAPASIPAALIWTFY